MSYVLKIDNELSADNGQYATGDERLYSPDIKDAWKIGSREEAEGFRLGDEVIIEI